MPASAYARGSQARTRLAGTHSCFLAAYSRPRVCCRPCLDVHALSVLTQSASPVARLRSFPFQSPVHSAAQLSARTNAANLMPEAVYEYRCAQFSATEAFTQASCPAGCISGEDPPLEEADRFYCYCPSVKSYDECVAMLPGPEGGGPQLNEGASCGELVAQSLDGATCETRGDDMYRWAQACCVDKKSICPGTSGGGGIG